MKIRNYFKNRKKFLSKEYKKAFSFIKESKKYIWIMFFIFVFCFFIGFFVKLPLGIESKLLDYLKDLFLQAKGLGPIGMIWFLFSNNVVTNLFIFVLGIFFGIFPLLNVLVNGFILGFVSKINVLQNGVFSLWKLFPHGIFEIPALMISLGIGLNLGICFFRIKDKEEFKKMLTNSFRVFILIIVPLLIIAAIIEGLLISF